MLRGSLHLAGRGSPGLSRAGLALGAMAIAAGVIRDGCDEATATTAVAASLAVTDVVEHALAVDVLRFQVAQLSPAHEGRVERHQHGAMKQVAGRFDQPHRFLLGQDDPRLSRLLRAGKLLDWIVPP